MNVEADKHGTRLNLILKPASMEQEEIELWRQAWNKNKINFEADYSMEQEYIEFLKLTSMEQE